MKRERQRGLFVNNSRGGKAAANRGETDNRNGTNTNLKESVIVCIYDYIHFVDKIRLSVNPLSLPCFASCDTFIPFTVLLVPCVLNVFVTTLHIFLLHKLSSHLLMGSYCNYLSIIIRCFDFCTCFNVFSSDN